MVSILDTKHYYTNWIQYIDSFEWLVGLKIILLQYITVLLFLLLIATWREGSICILVFASLIFPGFLVCVGMYVWVVCI